MADVTTADGRYRFVEQGDGNVVVYDRGRAVWDRWSYEAAQGVAPVPAPLPPPDRPIGPPTPGGIPRLIRVTDARDGELLNRGYAYWSQAWVAGRTVMVFCGHADGRPRFFQVDLTTGQIERLGSILSYTGTSEGWYWNAQGEISIINGAQLHRINPRTGADTVVMDISDDFPGHDLWQAHSSEDGRTHCATVRKIVSDGAYPYVGTVVQRGPERIYFPAQGPVDESQITPEGRWLVIKEGDDNRIIDLQTRDTRLLLDADGAVGHSDCGPGFVVGEDNIHGACVRWDLTQPLTPERRRELFSTWNMGHVSIRHGRCLLSDGQHLSLVPLEGGEPQPILDHGMTGEGYDYQVFANLDPSGLVAAFMSNAAGRMDLYLLVIA